MRIDVRKLSTVEFRDRLSESLNEAAFGNKATIVERHGRGIAILMPLAMAPDVYKVQAGIVTSVSGPEIVTAESITTELDFVDGG